MLEEQQKKTSLIAIISLVFASIYTLSIFYVPISIVVFSAEPMDLRIVWLISLLLFAIFRSVALAAISRHNDTLKGKGLLKIGLYSCLVATISIFGMSGSSISSVRNLEQQRSHEASSNLIHLQREQTAFYMEKKAYESDIGNFGLDLPVAKCDAEHYFSYSCESNGDCVATRCISGGKYPNAKEPYKIILKIEGEWGSIPIQVQNIMN